MMMRKPPLAARDFDFPLVRPSRLRAGQPTALPAGGANAATVAEPPAPIGRLSWHTGVAIGLTCVAMAIYGIGSQVENVPGTGGALVAPLLMAIVILLTVRRTDALVPSLPGLLQIAFALKLAVSYLRFRSGADSVIYDQVGRELAESFRRFDFAVDTDRTIPGTGTVRYLTGLVHAVTGSSFSATFLIFTFFGFWGQYFFFRAVRVGLPGARLRRYALLVLFWPSLVFWPSSIGKESLTLLGLGLSAYGLALLLAHRRGGVPAVLLGLFVTTMVRPHIGLVFVIAALAPFILRARTNGERSRPAATVVAVLLLLVAAYVTTKQTEKRLALDELNSTSLVEQLDRTVNQTSQGGGQFEPVRVRTPLDLPWAGITVMFRPFPHEARGGESLIASIEGLALLALLAIESRTIGGALRQVRRLPLVAFVLLFAFVFVFLFSSIANFGILARQRTQLTPLVLMLLALPRAARSGRRA